MKRPLLMLLLGAVLAALAVGLILFPPTQPSYGGKRIRTWFAEELARGPSRIWSAGVNGIVVTTPANKSTLDAFQHMGQSAVPFLIRSLQAKDSPFKKSYVACYNRLPEFAQRKLPKPQSTQNINVTAAFLLASLGPEARPAVPALIQCLIANDQRLRESAILALASIGPDAREAIPALKLLAQDRSHSLHVVAEIALARIDRETAQEGQ